MSDDTIIDIITFFVYLFVVIAMVFAQQIMPTLPPVVAVLLAGVSAFGIMLTVVLVGFIVFMAISEYFSNR